jgi:hypothetical protein
METVRKTLLWIGVLLIAYGAIGDKMPTITWDLPSVPGLEWFASKPKTAIVVRESADAAKLTKEQIAWLASPKIREDAKKAGLTFLIVDPDVKDKAGNTPADLAPAIAKAKAAGPLPRLILVGPRGGLTAYALPANDSTARARLGLGD